MYLSGGPAASNRQVRYEFEITKNNNVAFEALYYFDTTCLCIQGVRPRRDDHGLRNRCLNLHCLQVIIKNLVVSKAANQARALNLYTPCLSTHHLQLAPPTALTPAETLIWVSKQTNELNEKHLKERWLLTCYLAGGTPIFGPCRVSEILPSDSLDGLPYSASQFDPLYNLDQLPEDDRESDRCL